MNSKKLPNESQQKVNGRMGKEPIGNSNFSEDLENKGHVHEFEWNSKGITGPWQRYAFS